MTEVIIDDEFTNVKLNDVISMNSNTITISKSNINEMYVVDKNTFHLDDNMNSSDTIVSWNSGSSITLSDDVSNSYIYTSPSNINISNSLSSGVQLFSSFDFTSLQPPLKINYEGEELEFKVDEVKKIILEYINMKRKIEYFPAVKEEFDKFMVILKLHTDDEILNALV